MVMKAGQVYYFTKDPGDVDSYVFYDIAIDEDNVLEMTLEDVVNCYIVDYEVVKGSPLATRLQKFKLIKAMFTRGVWDAR
jgi:hypothetical protein